MIEILSHEINSDIISLTTTLPVVGLTVSFGDLKFKTGIRIWDLNSNNIIITKEDLGLDTLKNRYFRIQLTGDSGEIEESIGLYHVDVENNKKTPLYDALKLKQELDNLNYYTGILQSLNEKKAFREANEIFFNYITFLEKEINGYNFIQTVSGSKCTDIRNK